jgi:ComF family protein
LTASRAAEVTGCGSRMQMQAAHAGKTPPSGRRLLLDWPDYCGGESMLARTRAALRAAVERWALPQRCLFCAAAGPVDGVCGGCRQDLPGWKGARCPVCANLSASGEVCGECLASPPACSRVIAAVSYRFPVDGAILRLKYGADLAVVEPLAALLAQRVSSEARPDLMLAMPMSAQRLRERGFDQAREIARAVAARLELPLGTQVCRRVRHTPPQAMLPWDERRRNIRGAFECNENLDGAHIAIADDVLTTGATMNELAGVLLRAGAAEVVGWVVARAEKP